MKDEQDSEIKDRIKVLKEIRALSSADIANKSGISPSAISMIESGRRIPSASLLVKLALTLNTTVDYLVGREVLELAEEKAALRDFISLEPKQQRYTLKQIELLKEIFNEN